MRLGTVHYNGKNRLVAALPDGILLDLMTANGVDSPALTSMQSFIEHGEQAMALATELIKKAPKNAICDPSVLSFRAPIPVPAQIRDCLVFETHLVNSFARATEMTGTVFDIPPVWYEQPIYYKGNRFSVIGHEQDVEWPSFSELMDYELELAVVIGKKGKDIPADEADNYIFGYTIYNDMTARDAQMKEMAGKLGPAKGKDFDTGNILGPFILTADEVSSPVALEMQVRVNGKLRGGGNSSQMHHTFGDIIAHISACETLHPGEVIGSGTVGTGCGLESGQFLSDGDEIELSIEKIGSLKNRLVKGSSK